MDIFIQVSKLLSVFGSFIFLIAMIIGAIPLLVGWGFLFIIILSELRLEQMEMGGR